MGVDPLAFPLFDMLLFSSFVTAVLLMLLAYISIIVAAVARLPGMLPMGPFVLFGLGFHYVIAAVIYDLVSRRRVHRVYLWGGTILAISVPRWQFISGTAAWRAFAETLTQ